MLFSIKFRILSKKSELLSERFQRVFQNYHLYVIRNILKKNCGKKIALMICGH